MNSIRKWTPARVAIGRAGHAIKTRELLDFQLAHAQARDAIHLPWSMEAAAAELRQGGFAVHTATTAVLDRDEYLKRPDLGRQLSSESRAALATEGAPCDVACVISNGLSSAAVMNHAIPVATQLLASLQKLGFSVAPLVLVGNARVAVSDEIGSLLQARLVLMIIGERPGLSSADSLAIYLTHAPKVGNTDAERNCISNIREGAGLSYSGAVDKAVYLTTEALRRGYSGVHLKDETPKAQLAPVEPTTLLPTGS
jgi:ethanolamine ammonia-lyase small subunit